MPIVRVTRRLHFSAGHRLHNPELSEDENRKIYGQCNNPSGHGHNYRLEVTLRGRGGGFRDPARERRNQSCE